MQRITGLMRITRAELSAGWKSALLLAVTGLLVNTVQARETEHFFEVAQAVDSKLGRTKLLDVPFYMKGQAGAPETVKLLGTWSQERSSRGLLRGDKKSCDVAFLSSLIAIQESAKKDGADTIVNLVSSTRGKTTESATHYRCVAGATIVHVGLTGDVITTK